jgi:hypothetical protein
MGCLGRDNISHQRAKDCRTSDSVCFGYENKKTVESWGSVFHYERLQLYLSILLIQSMDIYYIYNHIFLGFCTPSSQMQVKD